MIVSPAVPDSRLGRWQEARLIAEGLIDVPYLNEFVELKTSIASPVIFTHCFGINLRTHEDPGPTKTEPITCFALDSPRQFSYRIPNRHGAAHKSRPPDHQMTHLDKG